MSGIIWIAIWICGIACFALGNCATPLPKLQHSLEQQGFTDVVVGDWDLFECAADDTISREFRAKNTRGQIVHGTICCGYFIKGCTVRW